MAFLTQPSVATYLLQQGLVTPASIVHDELAIEDASQRNSNFKVTRKHGPCYLLKQGVDAERIATIEREAQTYAVIQSLPGAREIRPYLPRLYHYDPTIHVLILELLRNATDLKAYYGEGRPFLVSHGAAIGEALAHIHQLNTECLREATYCHAEVPWVLNIHRPDLTAFRNISAANAELISIIQQTTGFADLLDEVRGHWKCSTLIHADVRWGNWLLCKSTHNVRDVRLKLVDWELAAVGDPCWDVGSVFSEYLSLWVFFIPPVVADALNELPAPARRRLSAMQNSIKSFWSHYSRTRGFTSPSSYEFLLMSVRYAAVRLIQTAYESLQSSWRLNAVAVRLLQLSLNILKQPEHAITRLLGFTPEIVNS